MADIVDLWFADLRAAPPDLEPLLGEDERARAQRLAAGPPRARFAARRALRRALLAGYVGRCPEGLRFTHGAAGKPELAAAGELQFSCSSSRDVAVVAVARGRRVGVDVERLRPVREPLAIARSLLAEEEQAALAALAPAERDAAFLRCWTCKEARVKASGAGLGMGLDGFAVSVAENVRPQLLADGFAVRGVAAPAGHVAALAAEGADWRVRRRAWSW